MRFHLSTLFILPPAIYYGKGIAIPHFLLWRTSAEILQQIANLPPRVYDCALAVSCKTLYRALGNRGLQKPKHVPDRRRMFLQMIDSNINDQILCHICDKFHKTTDQDLRITSRTRKVPFWTGNLRSRNRHDGIFSTSFSLFWSPNGYETVGSTESLYVKKEHPLVLWHNALRIFIQSFVEHETEADRPETSSTKSALVLCPHVENTKWAVKREDSCWSLEGPGGGNELHEKPRNHGFYP